MPKEFCDLVNLRQLDISYNKIMDLPEDIYMLANLTVRI